MSTPSKIELQKPFFSEKEKEYVAQVFQQSKTLIQRSFLTQAQSLLEKKFNRTIFLLPNCTSAMEIVALAENIEFGDEVIMPSFTYVSSANAFVRSGAIPVFVDIEPDTMNMDVEQVEKAITPKTKAVLAVHYAGVACNMKALKTLCQKHHLLLIEDAAHAFDAKYNDEFLGTIGDYGVISFDHTKNIHCGQGGLLIVNNENHKKRIHYIYENGTNRSDFVAGDVPYFEWVSVGSKFYLSDLNAAVLLAQLENADEILHTRLTLWNKYYSLFSALNLPIELPKTPSFAQHNGHVFYVKTRSADERKKLQQYLAENNIQSAFHFIPLHTSSFGKQIGRFVGEDKFTTKESERLLRLPLHNYLSEEDVARVVSLVQQFYNKG